MTDTNQTLLLKFGKELTRAENKRGCDRPGTGTSMTDYREMQKVRKAEPDKQQESSSPQQSL